LELDSRSENVLAIEGKIKNKIKYEYGLSATRGGKIGSTRRSGLFNPLFLVG